MGSAAGEARDHEYLLDYNVLAKLTRQQCASRFVRECCHIPSEVLSEASGLPDIAQLAEFERSMTPAVLAAFEEVMATLVPGDTSLVDLCRIRGNADSLPVPLTPPGTKSSTSFALRGPSSQMTRLFRPKRWNSTSTRFRVLRSSKSSPQWSTDPTVRPPDYRTDLIDRSNRGPSILLSKAPLSFRDTNMLRGNFGGKPVASPRTNKARKRARESPWRLMRGAPDLGDPPESVPEAYAAGFGARRNLEAFADAVGGDHKVLGFALSRWDAERRAVVADTPLLLPAAGWQVLGLIPPADAALTLLGAGWRRVSPSVDIWADELRGGLDAGIDVLIKMRQGLNVAAVVGARAFLERWTFNVASSHSLEWKQKGESDSEFISRVWDTYGLDALGRDPGRDWASLSELQHGRKVAIGNRTIDLGASGTAQFALFAEIARIIEIPLRQVRGAIREHAAEAGIHAFDLALSARLGSGSMSREPAALPRLLELPDLVSMHDPALERARLTALDYRVHSSHTGPDGIVDRVSRADTVGCLVERLSRRFENAAAAAAEEQAMVGERFDYGHLAARLFRYLSIAAMAEAVGLESSDKGGHHLRLAGNALTSATNYWLEDNDLSLPSVRVLAEQTSVARAHRLKPDKAARLEARSDLPASRWFELAGWARLSVFVRALGEFSHVGLSMRRDGAREALITLNVEDDDDEAPYGARREALDQAAYMLAHEIATRLDKRAPDLSSAFRKGVTLLDATDHEERLADWLNLALANRAADFGDPDVMRPSNEVASHLRAAVS